MEILLSGTKFYQQDIHLLLREKMETDEKIVRKALVKVWTKVLEKYARPGAVIPPAELLRKELYDAGVDAAINAVVDEHWFVFSFYDPRRGRNEIGAGIAEIRFGWVHRGRQGGSKGSRTHQSAQREA